MRRKPTVLNTAEINALCNQLNVRYRCGQRNLLIIKLFLNTGLKLSEMLDLTWEQVDLSRHQLSIDKRTLPFNSEIADQIIKWQTRQLKETGECIHVFTTGAGQPLKKQYVRAMIKNYSHKANIDKIVNPNVLRHTFAFHLYDLTKDLQLVQKALGHKNISNTAIYAYINKKRISSEIKEIAALDL